MDDPAPRGAAKEHEGVKGMKNVKNRENMERTPGWHCDMVWSCKEHGTKIKNINIFYIFTPLKLFLHLHFLSKQPFYTRHTIWISIPNPQTRSTSSMGAKCRVQMVQKRRKRTAVRQWYEILAEVKIVDQSWFKHLLKWQLGRVQRFASVSWSTYVCIYTYVYCIYIYTHMICSSLQNWIQKPGASNHWIDNRNR